MEDYYEIFKFTYKNANGSLKTAIYAREVETAEKIVAVLNTESSFHWVPVRFRFKVKRYVNRPPYEFEQEQLEATQEELERRRAIRAKREKENR